MKLLESIKVGNIEFKNRIMFPPLTTGYEEKDGSIGEQSFRFYERLAKGGVGYIVIGDVAPLPTFSPTPKLYSPEQVQSFKRLADACHENGAKLGIQLFHPDYNVKALNDLFHQGKMQEARAKLHHDMQHFVNEVTAEELDEIIKHMENCAILAHEAGVDCIEVHGDRLVGSLCSPIFALSAIPLCPRSGIAVFQFAQTVLALWKCPLGISSRCGTRSVRTPRAPSALFPG